jgi:hypothetical protein
VLLIVLGAALVTLPIWLPIWLHGERGAPNVAAAAGFNGDVSQSPRGGTWRATGTYTTNRGYSGGRTVGEQIVRRWTIARRCASGTCSLFLTRQMRDLPPLTAPLRLKRDGWHATFPELTLFCRPPDVTWQQRSTVVYRFTNGGRSAQAHEVNLSYAEKCGYGTSRLDWVAEHAGDRE